MLHDRVPVNIKPALNYNDVNLFMRKYENGQGK